MPNSSIVRPQNTLYFLKEKCKDLPRNQPNGNHIVVLHEACLCTEFPLHKMCANKYKKQIKLYGVIGVMTTCADPFLSLELGNWLVHTFWIASFGPGSNSKILHKPSTYPTERVLDMFLIYILVLLAVWPNNLIPIIKIKKILTRDHKNVASSKAFWKKEKVLGWGKRRSYKHQKHPE